MDWTRTREEEGLIEWTREDGYATLRRRHRPDGTWVVRLDRLQQAPEGSGYRRERVDDDEAAVSLLETWKGEVVSESDAQ
ncbi:MAG: hypothetical protein ABEI27_01505 [Halobellus sp.]|uniref:DUF7543 family protein n=1 Tax=Halobellus sp. TaxID=1979212 RepID=UPI0035D4CD42